MKGREKGKSTLPFKLHLNIKDPPTDNKTVNYADPWNEIFPPTHKTDLRKLSHMTNNINYCCNTENYREKHPRQTV